MSPKIRGTHIPLRLLIPRRSTPLPPLDYPGSAAFTASVDAAGRHVLFRVFLAPKLYGKINLHSQRTLVHNLLLLRPRVCSPLSRLR